MAMAPANTRQLLDRLASTLIWTVVGLSAVACAALLRPPLDISDVFFLRQDAMVALAIAVFLVLLARFSAGPFRQNLPAPASPRALVVWAALACAAVALVGEFVVYRGYALSLDEFLAKFDALIFARGRLFGELPAAWAPYRDALQPIFRLDTPSANHWSSSYLPMNAVIRAVASRVGLDALVGPAWAAVAVLATWGVGRRIWPERPQTALCAALLVATSSQVAVNAMTAYAMPAHLALNMVWLLCFLRGGRLGHAAALGIGFVAAGLHQVAFHPLFVAPFVLQLWLDRRWRLALLYTAAYAGIGLFWISYWNIAFAVAGFGAPQDAVGAGGFLARVQAIVVQRQIDDAFTMAKNLIRFIAWQNPLTTPLFVLSAVGALNAKGHLRALLFGVGLTLAVVIVVLPFQGHGWGYRYLHGLIGSICLLAAWTWTRLTDALAEGEQPRAKTAFAMAAVVSVLVLAPVHAWQASAFLSPYARASAAIAKTDADVVLVDDRGIWYGQDLVRNDPFVRNRPVVLWLGGLSEPQVREVCGRGGVVLFDVRDAEHVGVRRIPTVGRATSRARMVVDQLACGKRAGNRNSAGDYR